MPTRWSRTLIPTLRQPPADAVAPSHQLMLRAGCIHMLGAGVYDYLPLGLRSLRKAMQIVREEMDAAGAVEVLLPTLQPIELWEKTGRRAAYGDNLFVVTDRHGRENALGPTHEEVITTLVGDFVESYRQLPLTLYQIQTKFRDEFRPRFGVIRSREFQMKDAYSFHLTVEGSGGLDETYQKQYDAYCRIFSRCGLPYKVVEAESGPIGGSASHEFMVPSPTGEDTILESDSSDYAANVEKAEIGPRKISETLQPFSRVACDALTATAPTGDIEKVHTPDCPAIEDVCAFFKKELGTKLKARNMLKTLLYSVKFHDDTDVFGQESTRKYAMVIVRGDHDVNDAKLRAAIKELWAQQRNFAGIELADVRAAEEDGFAIGFVGPQLIRKNSAKRCISNVLVDYDAAVDQFWVTGANEVDHHVKHFNWQRDFLADVPASPDSKFLTVADIRNAVDGDPAPESKGGGTLRETKGIEIGHVFKLGCKYTDALKVSVSDEDQKSKPVFMGCYGIGVNRILASAIERAGGHDDDGVIWPAAIAPYSVLITTIKHEGEVAATAEKLAADLEASTASLSGVPTRVDVLIDDRDERPGVKFKDADLIGIPVRVTVGDRGLKEGKVEIKARNGSNGAKGEMVDVAAAVDRVIELLATL